MSLLDHSIYLSPLVDVLFTYYVRVDEEVSVPDTEVFLAGSTFEAFKVIHFVLHPHGHLVSADSLVAGGTKAILAKEPEIVPSAELSAQFVIQASPHLAQPAAAEVAAEAVFVPVLVDGFQEVAVPDVLLATAACQQRGRNLEDFIHRLLGRIEAFPLDGR